ncbi:MAG: hypothetical protein ACI4JW_09415 [Oscillospiraceae bacterium]
MKSKINYKTILKYVIIIVILIALSAYLHLRIVVFPDGFDMPMNYRISYFGKDYYELYSIQTDKEKKIGEEIVDRARACMEYTGSEEDAPETDALSIYYYWDNYKKPSRTEVDISLRKAVIHRNKGSVWINYSLYRFDENNESISGAHNILARCTIEKDDSGEWVVTSVHRPP